MNQYQWQEVETLFHAAVELNTPQRAAFLTAACNGNAALRHEVESLLAAEDEAAQHETLPLAVKLVAPPVTHAAPSTLSHYQLRHEIGSGGMGAVWLAERRDDQFQQRVAIKLVTPPNGNRDIIRRFRHERQILASLDHPHIARLLDGGTTSEGQPYFVMEYIAGQPIDEYCRQHELDLTERLRLFRAVCSAVQYAHQNLVIHRDLKPSNILVTADGTPKLLDFGIAKLLQPDLSASYETMTGATPMTPAYASPEQVRGEKLTTTSDVYSLGVILYELLTGQSPYQLTNPTFSELTRAVCEQEPLRPSAAMKSEVRSQKSEGKRKFLFLPTTDYRLPTTLLKGDLDAITLKALRKEPIARYSSVEQLSEDIQRHLEGLPVAARKGTISYRAARFVRRHKVPVAAATLILLSLFGGIGATSHQARIARIEQARAIAERNRAEAERVRAEQALAAVEAERTRAENAFTTAEQRRKQAEAARAEANQQRVVAEAERNVAQTQQRRADEQRQRAEAQELSNWKLLYASRMGLAMQAWEASNVGRMRDLLAPYWPRLDVPDLRGFEWSYLWKLSHQEQKTFSFSSPAQFVRFSLDGRQLLTSSRPRQEDGTVRPELAAHDLVTGQVQGRIPLPAASMLAITPDQQWMLLAMSQERAIKLYSLATAQEVSQIKGLPEGMNALAITPDGGRLAVGLLDGSLLLFDLATKQELLRLKPHAARVATIIFSDDGQQMLSIGRDRTLSLRDASSGQERHSFTLPTGIPYSALFAPDSALFSPDGKMIVTTSSGSLTAWDTASGKQLIHTRGAGRRLAFSPDSQTLACGGEDAENQVEIRFLSTSTWQTTKVLRAHGNMILSLAFSPDGKQLASSSEDRTVKIWNLDTTQDDATINDQPRGDGAFVRAVLSPDGKRILVGQETQTAQVWDVATRQLVLTLKGHTRPTGVARQEFPVAISPDNRIYATGGQDSLVKVWEAETGRELHSFSSHSFPAPAFVTALSFSRDGRVLAAGCNRLLRRWDLATGRELTTVTAHAGIINALVFAPDNQSFFTASDDGMVKQWDEAGQLLRAYRVSDSYTPALAFTPDGRMFATGSGDALVRLWDTATGQEVMTLKGHSATVSALTFSPDGKRLVSGSWDKSVRLWDLTTGQEMLLLKGHTGWITHNSIGFSRDGRFLFTTAWNRIIKFWQTATEQEIIAQRNQ